MKITATLSDEFLLGEYETNFATDWPFLNPKEQKVIAEFIYAVGNSEPLKGKNKPSWVDDNYEKITGTDGYEEGCYWHYHCGPGWRPSTFKGLTIDLKFNPNGMHSDECIHYIKHNESSITIVGYSRKHIPYLLSDYGNSPFFPEDD